MLAQVVVRAAYRRTREIDVTDASGSAATAGISAVPGPLRPLGDATDAVEQSVVTALGLLDGIDELPVADHAAVYQSIHDALHAGLTEPHS